MAVAVLGVLGILIVPLPPAVLDAMLAVSIALSVLMLLVALGLKSAQEFSVFPSLLLVTTLFRLALNVATTRLVLLHGGEGPQAAGHVIEAFGRFAVGGSLIVGGVIFMILLVVNFSVITKGSGRISEVAARFTLDALPGKQMAIDADLAAGIITDAEAKLRRKALEGETEFFGAMDGASKFVRGDAVAGLFITGINIVGGFLAGVVRDGNSLAQAAETYTLLTVGDGLVSQMPALLVSTAAGVLVTRAAGADLGSQVGGQLVKSPRALRYSSAVLAVMSLVPGLPAVPFLGIAAVAFILSRRAEAAERAPQPKAAAADAAGKKGDKADRPQDMLALDALSLEVGYALLPLIDPEKGGEVPGRITALRKQVAKEMGIVLPALHLCDNLRLDANEYRLVLRGVELARGKAWADRLLCLNPEGAAPQLDGIASTDPAFGLPAVWVEPAQRSEAEGRGYTVVDCASAVTTHLSELVRKNAHELVGRQEVQELLGLVSKEAPKLVEDTIPAVVGLGDLVRVVKGLLREGLSVRDLRTVLEAVADAAPKSKDTVFLVEQVRKRFARQITSRLSVDGTIKAIVLDRKSEDMLRGTLGQSDGEAVLAPDVEVARRLITGIETHVAALLGAGRPGVVIAPPELRRPLFDFASRFISDVVVVSARELLPGTTLEPAGQVQLS
ncbi:MAG: flagellar biosynthesis protein FlhA [Myxococcaceae bacterium]|nr:flagellar biosynthesis protein FlhA [Myxococcaceae bacterium]